MPIPEALYPGTNKLIGGITMVDLVNAFNVLNEFLNTEPKAAFLLIWLTFVFSAFITVIFNKVTSKKAEAKKAAANKNTIEKVG